MVDNLELPLFVLYKGSEHQNRCKIVFKIVITGNEEVMITVAF